MEKSFLKLAKITLVLVYLVIVAGAVVRMTGSGMGCPDWPKCFGYYIPPTDETVLEWQANRDFEKGQVIIQNKALWVATANFTTSNTYNPKNWEAYTKHDYAEFNVWHTWIEYINRLFGALAGFATLALAIFSFWFWKKSKKIPLLAWLVVFGMGFQAWLGATVVYSVLAPVRITLHMFMALAIVAMLLFLIYNAQQSKKPFKGPALIRSVVLFSIILSLIQIILGTQVRQAVDHQVDVVGYLAKNLWLENPDITFYVHRSLSILVLLTNGFLFWKIRKNDWKLPEINWVMLFILIEVLTGMAMFYLDFPFGSQPLHLVIASILFGIQFYLFLKVFHKTKNNINL
ncbi:heme A synthase [Flavobacterium sp. ASW18X]|uniref:COX15/CtaA family protein n=1 Tax=Flavobacterium sp. ASW18X TaxID=2572595 RepID=UPI0010ADDC02|nr:COX15/CtaA family protein [Flavobacterium sp. ASW18X]TKD56516.1 heme A synthase [Flavobacterium sp. ASW18X]